MTLGHHESEAAVRDEPARRERSAEQAVSGASPDAISAFTAMQEQARDDDTHANPGRSDGGWKRMLQRFVGRK